MQARALGAAGRVCLCCSYAWFFGVMPWLQHHAAEGAACCRWPLMYTPSRGGLALAQLQWRQQRFLKVCCLAEPELPTVHHLTLGFLFSASVY